jgi:hypothetical protein
MNVADNVIKMAIEKAEETKTVSKFPAPPINLVNYRAVKEPLFKRVARFDNEVNNGGFVYEEVPASVGSYIVRTDNTDILGIMKKRYAIVDNPDLDEPIREQLYDSLPKEALTEGSVKLVEKTSEGGSIARWGYHFDGLGREIRQLNKSETQLNFMVRIVNSFGGQTGIRLQAGALDLWCTNGCTSAELSSQSFGHTIGFDPSQVKTFIEEQVEFFQKRVELWQSWANKEITSKQASEVLKASYPASKSEIKKAEEKGFTVGEATSRKMRKMMEQLEREAEARGHTVWALYSALTNYSSHNSERFGVKNSANADNVETTLIEREREVNKVIELPEFKELAVA